MTDHPSPTAEHRAPAGDALYFFLLVLLNIWGSGIQGLIAPLTGALVLQFQLQNGDVLISYLMAAFLVLYGGASIGWAWVAERVSRHRLLWTTSLAWAGLCALAALATDFSMFFFLWCLTAVSSAALVPVSLSMTVDLVPEHRRGRAFGWMGTAQVMSTGQSFILGGFLVERAGWQLSFFLTALLGLLSAILLQTVRTYEPARGRMERELQRLFQAGGHYHRQLELRGLRALRVLLEPPANAWLVLSTFLVTIALAGIAQWFIRMLQKDHGLSTATATGFMLILFGCQVPGALLFGRLGDRLQRRWPDGKVRLLLLLPLLILPCYLIGFSLPVSLNDPFSLAGLAVCVILGAFVASGMSPLYLNLTGDVNRPEARGLMFSLLNNARMAGRAAGGILLTQISGAVFEGRLSPAMATLSLFILPAWLAILPIWHRWRRDRGAVQEALQRYASTQAGGPSAQLVPPG